MDDLRLAIRQLRATSVITAVAVLSLALGIGANTAIFSLVNSLALRPLPVSDPDRLVTLSSMRAVEQRTTPVFTYATWEEIHRRGAPFAGTCAWWMERLNLAQRGGEAEPGEVMWVTGEYFATLGVKAARGRTISPSDDMRGARPAAMISYELWQRRFGGADGVIGQSIPIDQVPFTIVGVTPRAFHGTEVGGTFDVILPMNGEPLIRRAVTRLDPAIGYAALTIMFRLRPGQSADDATSILRSVQPQVRDASVPPGAPAELRKLFLGDPFVVSPAPTGTSRLRSRYERPLLVLLVIVGFVLVVACANVANLQLARGFTRHREFAIRVALGASRRRLVRPALVENTLLSAAAGAGALLLAIWSSGALTALLSTPGNRVYLDLSLDWRVLAFTAVAGCGTALVFGTTAAWRASAVAPADSLRELGTLSAPRSVFSGMLIVLQVALSIVIVAAAGLFIESFARLTPCRGDSTRIRFCSCI